MYRRPCWVEISAHTFEKNYLLLATACSGYIAQSEPVEVLAIVKANAYGHGLEICVLAAVRSGAKWLGVTSVEEGVAARTLAPEAEILVICGPFPGQGADVIAHRLTPVVWDHWQIDVLEDAAKAAGCGAASITVHLELDTGMSRQGVAESELDGILNRLVGKSATDCPLRLGGIMTHLYAADETDGIVANEQMTELGRLVEQIKSRIDAVSNEASGKSLWLHVGNSAAVLGGKVLNDLKELSERSGLRPMVRPGLTLFGLAPKFSDPCGLQERELADQLQPVLEWKTRVVSVRSIDAGQAIGYNGTFVATEPMRVALLAVGYGDGLNRALSNLGKVLIRGESAPIIGRISMDQSVVDVTEIENVSPGDEVVLLGRQGLQSISAEDHARWAGTIPWEILTSIAARVERRPRK